MASAVSERTVYHCAHSCGFWHPKYGVVAQHQEYCRLRPTDGGAADGDDDDDDAWGAEWPGDSSVPMARPVDAPVLRLEQAAAVAAQHARPRGSAGQRPIDCPIWGFLPWTRSIGLPQSVVDMVARLWDIDNGLLTTSASRGPPSSSCSRSLSPKESSRSLPAVIQSWA